MSELSPRERAFIEAARVDWGPSCGPEPPAPSAIERRLADKPWLALPPEPLGPQESSAGFARLFGVTAIGACAIALVGFGALSRTEPKPTASVEAPAAATSVPAPVVDPAEPPPSVLPAVAIDALPDVAPPARAPSVSRTAGKTPERASSETSAPRDQLGEEIALIRAAQGDLRGGAPDRALASLATHASRFPRGVLRDERLTLQVLAFCERGDVAAARAVANELSTTSPGSSHLERLSTSCAAR